MMVAADVVAHGDGGGKARAFPYPVYGREKVARLVTRAGGIAVDALQLAEVIGQPGGVLLDDTGRRVVVVPLDLAGGLDMQAPPRHGRVVADRIPGAQFEVLAQEAHQPFEEAPEQFNARADAFWRMVEACS